MKITDVFGNTIHLTQERWKHILSQHVEISSIPHVIKQVLETPEHIATSTYDLEVFLYYRFYPDIWNGKFVVVVVKRNERNFILTTYITDKVKGGKIIWQSV